MSKYGAISLDSEGRSRQVCGFLGIPFKQVFASTAEYRRYVDLTRLQEAGLISDLRAQVAYDLHVMGPDGKLRTIAKYIADSVYVDVKTGQTITEDVKGKKTPIYQRSKKHLKAEYGIEILEVSA